MNGKNAITKTEGPCVVLAGAGTGKTYTIVEKIKHLVLEKGVDAGKIVCITFSNEAANNLILRVKKVIGEKAEGVVIRTFHGFSADLLRDYGEKIGINQKFRILDPNQAKVILHRNLKVNAGNCHKYISTIGTVKDLGIKIEEFEEYLRRKEKEYDGIDLEKRLENLSFELHTMHLSNFKGGRDKKSDLVRELSKIKNLIEIKKFVNAWRAYEKLKKKGNYLDYSDLNNYALSLLEKNPEIAKNYENFIVDEFQDTNKVQLDFLIKLAWNGNISVVGDLNQSIYRFRGAYRKNIDLFKKAFSVSKKDVFNLDKSFRSSNRILRVAHKLILNNYENPDDCLFVENFRGREGKEIEIYELEDAKEEARKVIEILMEEIKKGTAEEDICIIFRAHQYGRIIRKALEQEGIDYCAVSKQSLLKQKSIRTIVDYLTILNKLKRKERGGEQAWWDLAYQLNFSNDDLMKIGRFIKDFNKKIEKNKNEDEIEEKAEKNNVLSVRLFNSFSEIELSEDGKMASKILIEKLKAMLGFVDKGISELLKETYRISGLQNEQRTREEKEIMLNLNRFYENAKEHEELYDSDLSNFLYYLEILENLGIEIPAAEIEEKGIRLMTSHATKGLEYKKVIITNMASKRFPIETYRSNGLIPTELLPEIKEDVSSLSETDKEDFVEDYERNQQILEERRLAYVSFTRAKERLFLTYAKKYGNRKSFPSMFLHEIGFKENEDIAFSVDFEKKFKEPELEIKKGNSLTGALNSKDFDSVISEIINSDRKLNKEKEHKRFSPSALLLFDECQKQFEYKYVYNMPEKKKISWEAMRLGSFIHIVLEKGVSLEFKDVEKFLELAREMSLEEDWESVDFNEAETLIRVFYERNKFLFSQKSMTEQYLPLEIAGMNFIGFADRIDFYDNGEIGIVDYKTGKSNVSGKNRNWQLGFYALAAKENFENFKNNEDEGDEEEKKVRKIILDMLRHDKPLEFEIDDKGNASCLSSERIQGFNIYEVESELVQAAHKIQEAYSSGFKACPIEKNCEFCNEYVYGV